MKDCRLLQCLLKKKGRKKDVVILMKEEKGYKGKEAWKGA